MATRKMKLGLFIRPAAIISPAGGIRARRPMPRQFPHFVEMAQIAERGLFDMLFSADNHTVWTVSESAIDRVHYSAWMDPLYAAVGAVRLHQELASSAPPARASNRPYTVARKFRDPRPDQRRPLRLERGHVRQRNRGAELQQGAASTEAERYRRVREFVEVVRGLWIRGTRTRSSATRRPASSSTDRRCTSSTITAHSMTYAGRSMWRVAARAAGHRAGRRVRRWPPARGRNGRGGFLRLGFGRACPRILRRRQRPNGASWPPPDDLKVLPVCWSSSRRRAKAQAKFQTLQDLLHPELGLALMSRRLGYDLTGYPLDEPLPPLPRTRWSAAAPT